jgi:hypothetical protein
MITNGLSTQEQEGYIGSEWKSAKVPHHDGREEERVEGS